MGIIVNKDQPTDELSRRVAADLRQETVGAADPDVVDFADNSEYLKDSQKTSRFGWVWAILVVLAIGSIIVICMPGSF